MDQASTVFARAFFSDPLYEWFFPSEKTRVEKITALYRFILSTNLSRTLVVSDALEGIAIWEEPNDHGMDTIASLRRGPELASSVGVSALLRMVRFSLATLPLRRRWMRSDGFFLSVMVVDPRCQGKGIGKAMLATLLEEAERARRPVYLETQNPRNVSLYEHFGFTVVHKSTLGRIDHVIMGKWH